MNRKMCVAACVATLAAGSAMAMDAMMVSSDQMKMMDSNSDGKISKNEYMAYHEKMWTGMKKDSMGMVDGKMMMMPRDGMSSSMSKDPMSKDSMSKDSMSKDSMSKDSMSKDSMSKDPNKR